MNPLSNAQYEKHAGGHILIDSQEVACTLQCIHCGLHFVSIRGSGKLRGWCRKCNGVICGKRCAVCIPFERKLELVEGKPPTKSDELDYIFKHPEIL